MQHSDSSRRIAARRGHGLFGPADPPSAYVRAFMVTHGELVDGLPDDAPEPHKEWARQPKAPPVYRNDRSAAVRPPAQSKSQAKRQRAAKRAKMAAEHVLAATDSAVELPVPSLGQSAAAPAAALPAAAPPAAARAASARRALPPALRPIPGALPWAPRCPRSASPARSASVPNRRPHDTRSPWPARPAARAAIAARVRHRGSRLRSVPTSAWASEGLCQGEAHHLRLDRVEMTIGHATRRFAGQARGVETVEAGWPGC